MIAWVLRKLESMGARAGRWQEHRRQMDKATDSLVLAYLEAEHGEPTKELWASLNQRLQSPWASVVHFRARWQPLWVRLRELLDDALREHLARHLSDDTPLVVPIVLRTSPVEILDGGMTSLSAAVRDSYKNYKTKSRMR